MSRYSVAVQSCAAKQVFAGIGIVLPPQGEDVCLHFGYDNPLAVYFLDVENDVEYHECGYGGHLLRAWDAPRQEQAAGCAAQDR